MPTKIVHCLSLVVFCLALATTAFAQGRATYKLVFEATWSEDTHPSDFPSNPHFSGLIGGSHDERVSFWEVDELASAGIKSMAETGSKTALRNEVEDAIDDGTAADVLDGGGIGTSPGSRQMTFTITPDHPLVTVTSMLAPSPDWFVGVSGLSLLEDYEWIDTVEVELFVYDAGTDSGSTYDSPNDPTTPREPIAKIEGYPFEVDGQVVSVGTFSFTLNEVETWGNGFYTVVGTEIHDGNGIPAVIKGVGLGGWLVPEGYMLHIAAPDGGSPTSIRNQIVDLIGEADTDSFFEEYRQHYVAEKDVEWIAEQGYDHIRLPFHYKNFFDPDTEEFIEDGFDFLDTFLEWCRANDLGVILDMHAAPGAQNDGPISDSDGEARLWTEPDPYQDWAVAIWQEIATRYKDEKLIIGYDLINEPVTPDGIPGSDLKDLYVRMTDSIRTVDRNHIVFIEGNFYATTFDEHLQVPFDDNMVYTFHKYWNGIGQNSIQYLLDLRSDTNRPLWLGETGENSNPWFHAVVKLMDEHDIGWNWWTHKKIESTTSPLSAPFAPGYEDVLAYWRGDEGAERPTRDEAYDALFSMAEHLDLDSCFTEPGVLKSLFDPDFGTARIPWKEHVIPGDIFAADYDIGNQNITYSDTDVMATDGTPGGGNSGTKYRNDGVDIENSEDPEGYKFNVGWTNRLEWMTYSVTVEEAHDYDIDVRVASENSNGVFRLTLDGVRLGDDIEVESTGGWQNWVSIERKGLSLEEGEQEFKILVVEEGANINRVRFTKSMQTSAEDLDELPTAPELVGAYPNPFVGVVRLVFRAHVPVRARLEAFDILGRRVFSASEEAYTAGEHTLTAEPKLASGMYTFRLILDDGHISHTFARPLVVTR